MAVFSCKTNSFPIIFCMALVSVPISNPYHLPQTWISRFSSEIQWGIGFMPLFWWQMLVGTLSILWEPTSVAGHVLLSSLMLRGLILWTKEIYTVFNKWHSWDWGSGYFSLTSLKWLHLITVIARMTMCIFGNRTSQLTWLQRTVFSIRL